MSVVEPAPQAPEESRAAEIQLLTPDERVAYGKAARRAAPRSSHAGWRPSPQRDDPLHLLEEQARTRVPELVPIRHGRMLVSPFTFLRGAAYVMAADLAPTPRSGFDVQLCGDAHLGNFRGLASPERKLLFDINDFDETLPGPWEWDLKRLAASLVIAGRHRGFRPDQCNELARVASEQYRYAMRSFAQMSELDIWYSRTDERDVLAAVEAEGNRRQVKSAQKAIRKARRKDRSRAFEKLATRGGPTLRIAPDPPLIVPIEDLLPDQDAERVDEWVRGLVDEYRLSLHGGRRHLLDRYRYAHVARKVVGVGSVGTRAWVALLVGRDDDDVLFLQCKQAERSVLEPFVGKSEYTNMGRRVVEGQWLIQAAADVFLGWLRMTGLDGQPHDFYVRQLWDWKYKADFDTMLPANFPIFAGLCGRTLARAHARSGDAIEIAAYLGTGDVFDIAIEAFAKDYADQTERDYEALQAAVKSGRLVAEPGV
ncbi:MAG TPA: DUF2252 domain-containing protein [Thermoleophilaceae bacterium]